MLTPLVGVQCGGERLGVPVPDLIIVGLYPRFRSSFAAMVDPLSLRVELRERFIIKFIYALFSNVFGVPRASVPCLCCAEVPLKVP